MFKLFKTLLFIILLSSFANAEIVERVDITGNKRVSNETIKIYGNINLNQDYKDKKLNEILNSLYSTNFFEDIKIQIDSGVLKIVVKEFPVINQLIVVGEPSKKIAKEIKKVMSLKEKDSFVESFLSQDVDKIKQLYSSIGFNFVKVETKVKEIDDSNLDLVLNIKKGQVTKISKISFTGDKKIREKRLRSVIASEEDKFWKIITGNTKFSERLVNLDIRLLNNYYRSMGYYDVQINSNSAEIKKSGQIELVYSINAGKRYIINKIETNADPVFDKNIFYSLNEKYEKVVGEYYSPFKVKNLLEAIDELIEDNNLQFVEHNVEEIIENDAITIKFNIFESEKVLIERINILGNSVTNENVIRSELLLDEGDPYTKLSLDKSISKIRSRNIFRTVEATTTDGTAPNLKIIDIKVEEKPTGEVSAGAGIGTDGGQFVLKVKENNWLGEGKNLSFELDIDQESLGGVLNFTDPNYDFLGNSLNYYLSSTSSDKPDQGYENTVVAAGINTTFEQYKNIFTTLGISGSYDDLRTDGSASDSLKKQKGEFTELIGEYGFSYDQRDRSFRPTDGSIINFRQSLPIYADKSFVSNVFSYSAYNSFSENIIGASKFYFSAVNGLGDDDVRISKRRNLSSKRLRGFERGKIGPVNGNDHIGGNYAAALNLEASLPNFFPESSRTDLGVFLDFGNVWGVDYDASLDESNKIRSSAGVAASWSSPIGPMTFVFSQNLSKASTDKTESFNFNLGTTF